jgi:hypothetical protein
VIWDDSRIAFVCTGVPRATDPPHIAEQWAKLYSQRGSGVPPCEAASENVPSPDCPSPSGEVEASVSSQPTRIWIQIRPSNDETGDPGAIEEAYFVVLNEMLVLSDAAGFQIAEQKLLVDDDPARIARALLRARSAETEFSRPLPYRPLRLA